MLQAQNCEVVSPSDRSNLHPLVIPLAAHCSSPGQLEPVYTCLLRQVTLSSAGEQASGGELLLRQLSLTVKFKKQCSFAGHACGPDVTPVMSFELGCSQHRRVLAQVSVPYMPKHVLMSGCHGQATLCQVVHPARQDSNVPL